MFAIPDEQTRKDPTVEDEFENMNLKITVTKERVVGLLPVFVNIPGGAHQSCQRNQIVWYIWTS